MSRHENSSSLAWQERQTSLLVEEIKSVLSSLSDDSDLYNLLRESLSVKRRGLAPQAVHDTPWHLLPLIVCESICGNFERALPAAAAFQLMVAAGDVFDDIEDADSPESLPARYGSAISINAATTLIILAEQAIGRLPARGIEDSTTVLSYNAFNHYASIACRGQHLDLSITQDSPISEERYLKMIGMKSSAQIECACYVGALIATTDKNMVKDYANFGHNLGMAAQINNDLLGATGGKDIAKRKITLPAIYALNNTDKETHTELEEYYIGKSKDLSSINKIDKIRDLLINSGAVYYTTLQQELYKQKAIDALFKIASAGVDTDKIKLFLSDKT